MPTTAPLTQPAVLAVVAALWIAWVAPLVVGAGGGEELAFTSVDERAISGSDHLSVVAGLRWVAP